MQPFYLTVYSVFTTSLLDSVLALVLCLLFRNRRVAAKIGPGCMLALLLAVVIRTFFPLEFWYTDIIFIEDIFASLVRALNYLVWSFGTFKLYVKHCLALIWALGILVTFVLWYCSYRNYRKYLTMCPELPWEKLSRQYELKKEDYKGLERVKIVSSSRTGSPHVFGFKEKYLVLPDIVFHGSQLHYILLHELMHVQKKDILWKTLIDILCVGFWWNPIFWYLRKELNKLLEMRNDKHLADGFSKEEKASYMACLVDMAEQFAQKEDSLGLAFDKGDLKELKQRIHMLTYSGKTRYLQQIVAVVLVVGILLLNSTIVFEPTLSLEGAKKVTGIEEITEVEPMTKDNTFIVENGDQFDVYVDGEYLYTTDDIDYFKNYINIYKSLEDVKEE